MIFKNYIEIDCFSRLDFKGNLWEFDNGYYYRVEE